MNWGVAEAYRERRPNWHAVAHVLRQPWTADPEIGPTYNAAINGAVVEPGAPVDNPALRTRPDWQRPEDPFIHREEAVDFGRVNLEAPNSRGRSPTDS